MKIKLAIFDLDGTILDTLDDLTASTNYALASQSLPPRTKDEVREFVGNGIAKLIERAVPSGTSEQMKSRVYEAFTTHYRQHCMDATRPYDGMIELLQGLKSRDMKLAVVSNKADAHVQKLCEIYFPDIFDFVVGERVGIRKKPAPDSVQEVLTKLSISCVDAVYIGDSDVDIETASNAHMPCISVTWGFRTREFLERHGAIHIVDRVRELEGMLG